MSRQKFKTKLIRFYNPIRRKISSIYSFFIAGFIGKSLIELNEIDLTIINFIFYFLVFDQGYNEIKKMHEVVDTQTMGTKLDWLKKIYIGNLEIVKKTSLNINERIILLVGNDYLKEIIFSLDKLISDTRNPLVHSQYHLGWGNEYKWKLSYERRYFNKKSREFDNSNFTLKDSREYLKLIKSNHEKLSNLFTKLMDQICFTKN